MDSESRRTSESVATAQAVANEAEQPAPQHEPKPFERGVYRRLKDEGYRFGFFQAIRLLELLFPDEPGPGTTTDFAEAPIRLRPSPDLVFPATDIKRIEWTGENRVQVIATFMGLYGVDSPLPYYFYDDLAKDEEDTRPHRDFLDLFNQRLYAFFYRAWKKYRPGMHHRADGRDRLSKQFVALSGLGTPHASDDVPLAPLRLASQAGLLGPRVRNAPGLESLIEAFFNDIEVKVIENVPRWVPIPSRSGLGAESLRLGEDATIGEQVHDRSGKFRVRLGPMGIDLYLDLLPGGERAAELQSLVRLYAPDYLDFDVELQVHSDDMPPTRLGESTAQLGLTTHLGTSTEPILDRIVEYTDRPAAHA